MSTHLPHSWRRVDRARARRPAGSRRPAARHISVFTREVAAPDGRDRPYLVFLQGGPGFEATRPTSPPSGWLARALADFRVLLLDQRGTGRSTPVGSVIPGATPPIRPSTSPTSARTRSCATRTDPRRTRPRALERARPELRRLHLAHLPVARPRGPAGGADHRRPGAGDEPAGRRGLHGHLGARTRSQPALPRAIPGRPRSSRTILGPPRRRGRSPPNGDRLTARRFRQTGMWLGDSAGFERLHHLLELPFGRPAFLWDAQQASAWERNPIYATLHESSYADGGATRWSAHRVRPTVRGLRAAHGGARLPLDVGRLRGACVPTVTRRSCWPSILAAPVRRRPAGPQRGAGRCHDLRRRHLRRARVRRGDRGRGPRAAAGGSPTSTPTTGCARTASGLSAA